MTSVPTTSRCSPGEPNLASIQQVLDGERSSVQHQPADQSPTTLYIENSIIQNVRMSLCAFLVMVKDIAEHILESIQRHPTVSRFIIYAETNDIRKQQSELLKMDFNHLFNLLKHKHVSVLIYGLTSTICRGIGLTVYRPPEKSALFIQDLCVFVCQKAILCTLSTLGGLQACEKGKLH